jgi:two-component sensor histidine kinase
MDMCWQDKLRNLLQTLAFCLAISAMQYTLKPDLAYEVPTVYSLLTGITIWALIDLGRHLFPSAQDTGWPQGVWGLLMPTLAIVAGYVLGTVLGDAWFGWSSWHHGSTHLASSLIVTVLAGSGATYYFYAKNKGIYLERHIGQARGQAAEARLKLLETQLEPHMLFNTLANLRVLIHSDPTRAQDMLDRLVSYLRATLTASRSSAAHTLQAEFDRLRDYLELMAVRMGQRLQYTLDLPADLAAHSVPPLLLQALVENSIKHGLEPKVEGGSIQVRASRTATQLVLEVMDSGVGSSADLNDSAHNTGGFGVAQVRERLHNRYGTQAAIEFIATGAEGTRATITIPFNNSLEPTAPSAP